METKIFNIYEVANKCGFSVKHRATPQNVFFAFKSKESDLNLFFEVCAKNAGNEKTFCENVAHAVFLLSEDFDPHTETQKYLEKIGGNLTQYTAIYTSMNDLAWQVRSLWLSL